MAATSYRLLPTIEIQLTHVFPKKPNSRGYDFLPLCRSLEKKAIITGYHVHETRMYI